VLNRPASSPILTRNWRTGLETNPHLSAPILVLWNCNHWATLLFYVMLFMVDFRDASQEPIAAVIVFKIAGRSFN
jgi:hypothetical protein